MIFFFNPINEKILHFIMHIHIPLDAKRKSKNTHFSYSGETKNNPNNTLIKIRINAVFVSTS